MVFERCTSAWTPHITHFVLYSDRPLFSFRLADDALVDYYAVLSVSRDASPIALKDAYHRALLTHHPDKVHSPGSQQIPVSVIKEAYETLSSPVKRERYDRSLARKKIEHGGPRPAQVISLEEFDAIGEDDDEELVWTYNCRCGGVYRISETDMEAGKHLIACDDCSEVVWVGYELAEDEGEDAGAKEQ